MGDELSYEYHSFAGLLFLLRPSTYMVEQNKSRSKNIIRELNVSVIQAFQTMEGIARVIENIEFFFLFFFLSIKMATVVRDLSAPLVLFFFSLDSDPLPACVVLCFC